MAEETLRNFAAGSQCIVLAVLLAIFELFFTQAVGQAQFRWWIIALILVCMIEAGIKFLPARANRAVTEASKIRLLTLTSFAFGIVSSASVFFLNQGVDADGTVLLAVLSFAIAISAAITRHTIWLGSLGAIGIGLPLLGVLSYTTGNSYTGWLLPLTLLAWLCVIGLSSLLHHSFLNRAQLASQKELLLQNIEAKMRELEELRELEFASRMEAESANRSKSRFLAHVSHDLRQPLHALNLLVETIPENSVTPKTKGIIERIRDSLDMLTELFDSLLDLAMLNTGKVEVNLSTVPLEQMFQLIKREFEALADAQKITIQYSPTSLCVETDHIILRRMVQNLVSNAIKHAQCQTIEIRAHKHGDSISVSVSDDGLGILPEDQRRIFEEFIRKPGPSGKAPPQGLGLGLAIVHRLGDVLGLSIELRSEPDDGACFQITGLNQSQQPGGTAAERADEETRRARGTHALVVDDDAEVLAATEALLSKWGYTVTTQTLADFEIIDPPDIMICDFELADGKTGMDVISRIRAMFGEGIPALIITGSANPAVQTAADQQAVPVLRKPLRPAQLRSAVLTVLSSPAQIGELEANQ